jgi:hypothetical protein
VAIVFSSDLPAEPLPEGADVALIVRDHVQRGNLGQCVAVQEAQVTCGDWAVEHQDLAGHLQHDPGLATDRCATHVPRALLRREVL